MLPFALTLSCSVGVALAFGTAKTKSAVIVDAALGAIFKENALELVGSNGWAEAGPIAASTDAGDLSHIMPTIQPHTSGAAGTGHGADYRIEDPEAAILTPAKAMAMTLIDLLAGNAAQSVLDQFTPRFTKDEYLAFQRRLAQTVAFDGASV